MNMEENYKHDDIISCEASECCLRVIAYYIHITYIQHVRQVRDSVHVYICTHTHYPEYTCTCSIATVMDIQYTVQTVEL